MRDGLTFYNTGGNNRALCRDEIGRVIDERTENLTPGCERVNGYLSAGSRRKIKRLADAWADVQWVNQSEGRSGFLNFVTLTLPARQLPEFENESDVHIKRTCLKPWLDRLTRKGKKYIWKAEPQKSGSIHFHIITDAWIDIDKDQRAWNRLIERNTPLMQRYFERNKTREMPRNILDVDRANNPDAMAGYIAKYIYCDKGGRLLKGKLWGCSAELRNLRPFTICRDAAPQAFDELAGALNARWQREMCFRKAGEHYDYLGVKTSEIERIAPKIAAIRQRYFSDLARSLRYPKANPWAIWRWSRRTNRDLMLLPEIATYGGTVIDFNEFSKFEGRDHLGRKIKQDDKFFEHIRSKTAHRNKERPGSNCGKNRGKHGIREALGAGRQASLSIQHA